MPPHPPPPNRPSSPDAEPRILNGRVVVVVTLLAFIAIGLGFQLAGRYFSDHPIVRDRPLDLADRDAWEPMPTTAILLEEPPNYMRGPYGSKVPKALPFAVSPEAEGVFDRLHDALTETPTPAIEATLDQPAHGKVRSALQPPLPEEAHFYAAWLERLLTAAPTDRQAAAARSFAQAPAALVLSLVTPDGRPFADRPVGEIEIAFARKADDRLDDSLRLRYPLNRTDARGRVILPVFDTPLKITAGPAPPGFTVASPPDAWLIFPGNIGTPDPLIVTAVEHGD
jgi:hypothetical protein